MTVDSEHTNNGKVKGAQRGERPSYVTGVFDSEYPDLASGYLDPENDLIDRHPRRVNDQESSKESAKS